MSTQSKNYASVQHEHCSAENSRPVRVLLVPNVSWWVIGEMARQIAATLVPEFECYIVPESVFVRCASLRSELLRRADVLHVMDEGTLEQLESLEMPEHPPMITWIHHVTTWSRWHQAAVEKSQSVVACTAEWARLISCRIGGRLPVVIAPHAVDSTYFRRKSPDRAALGIPDGKFAVGFAASKTSDYDNQRKGLDTLDRVLREAAERIPELHIAFAGIGWEEDIRRLNADGISASYIGYLKKSALPRFYSALDAYLITSRVEGGPLTTLEAMACETPVVATRVGLIPEVIEDGKTGFSADVGDVQGLVNGLIRLYAEPELRARIARDSRLLIEQRRNWKTALAALAECYRQFARTGPVRPSTPTESPRGSAAPDSAVGTSFLEARGPSPEEPPTFADRFSIHLLPAKKLSNAACAADCLITTYRRMATRKMPPTEALRQLPRMLGGARAVDLLRASVLLAGR